MKIKNDIYDYCVVLSSLAGLKGEEGMCDLPRQLISPCDCCPSFSVSCP